MNRGAQPTRPLTIRLFGQFEVLVNGTPIPKMRSRKDAWLLALLVLQHEREVSRDWLAQTLWPFPDHSEDMARNYLRRGLWQIGMALGEQAYRLQKSPGSRLRLLLTDADVDVLQFDALSGSDSPNDLKKRLELYQGPLLTGCTEDWALREREKRHQAYQKTLLKAGAQAIDRGEPDVAASHFRHAIQMDPFWEPAQRGLMQALAASGDYNAATQVYHGFRSRLFKERNATPDPETVAAFASLKPSPPHPSVRALRSLPHYATPLVGRENELTEVAMRLRARRLVTLTGPGGIGKTRLAVRAAEDLQDEFPDGVYFVDLAAVRDPEALGQAVASVIGIQEPQSQTFTAALVTFLRHKQALLILDNAEHLIRACGDLARSILAGCPQVRLLATSRQSLGVAGETAWCVPSLATLDPNYLPADPEDFAAALARTPSARLFSLRATDARPGFVLNAENARAVAEICHYVEGTPLAIELTAARLHAMSVREVRELLEARFGLLALGSVRGITRHRTLRTAVAWSYDLLPEDERHLLSRLTVFRGGFTLDAAKGVGVDETVSADDIPPLVERLVEKSLVTPMFTSLETRFRLPEVIRQYSSERLRDIPGATPRERETNPEEELSRRCALWFARYTTDAASGLRGPQQKEWLERLEADHENLRHALDWSLQRASETEDAARSAWTLTVSLCHFWEITGRFTEGRERLQAVLKLPDPTDATLRARALTTAALLADNQRDSQEGLRLAEEAVDAARGAGDEVVLGHALKVRGWLNRTVAPEQATYLLEQALEMGRKTGDRWLIADVLSTLGFHRLFLGERDGGVVEALFQQGLEEARVTADRRLISELVYHLGLMAMVRGEYHLATGLLQEALEVNREMGNRAVVANRLFHLANCLLHQGDIEMAEAFFRECLITAEDLGLKRCVTAALEGLACVAAERGQAERAVSLFGAARTSSEIVEKPLFPEWGTDHDRYLVQANARMAPQARSLARLRGQMMTQEQVIRYALEEGVPA